MNMIALDFDGVLSDYTGWKGYLAPFDPPVSGAIEAIRDYQDAGLTVAIYTSRADSHASVIRLEQWLTQYGLEKKRISQLEITNKKPPALIYLDDRAMLFTGQFPSVEEIKSFKTWQQY
jgi:hypothetical protein